MNKELEKIERKLNKALDKEKKIKQDLENLTLEQELNQEEISQLRKKRRDIAQESTSITDDEAYQLFQTLSSKKLSISEALKALQKNQEGNN
jgi:predicted  nucleic acid-binding Zn-ribbon protein